MKVVMTLLVRDEGDIVEHCLVYHLSQGVDHVLVIDDGSTDGTTELLDSFRRAGVLTFVPRPQGAWSDMESTWRTRLARLAATEHHADWILTGDADEFWWPLWGNLKDVLGSVAAEREAVMAPRNDFVFASSPTRSAPQDFTVREKKSPLLPKLAFRASPAAEVFWGAHRVSFDPAQSGAPDAHPDRPFLISPTPGLRIFHYGVRNEAQFERLRGSPRPGRTSPALRDALYRRVPEDTSLSDLGPDWRHDAVASGLADGELVVDNRVASYIERCEDPRVDDRSRSSSQTPEPRRAAVAGELLEVQTLIFDHFQEEDAKLNKRIERLRGKVLKERRTRRVTPAVRAWRAIAKLSTNIRRQRL